MPHKLSPDDATPDVAPPAPVVRRISNPRLKKPSPKAIPAPDATAAEPTVAPVTEAGAVTPPAPATAGDTTAPLMAPREADAAAPAVPSLAPAVSESDGDDSPDSGDDWPEPDAPTTPGQESKRKRRRRKGKGQGQGQGQPFNGPQGTGGSSVVEETHAIVDPATPTGTDPTRSPRPLPNPPRQTAHRSKIDPEALTTKAWKIYLAEVSEEGVALISDQDARELARRCFRLAEIFIEEQARRIPSQG